MSVSSARRFAGGECVVLCVPLAFHDANPAHNLARSLPPNTSLPMSVSSFLYEPRHRSKMQKFKRWFLHSDPRLVATLMRSFFWWENVLWLSDDELDGGATTSGTTSEGTTRVRDAAAAPSAAAAAGAGAREESPGIVALFVAERDRYVDGPIIYADALKAKARRAERRARGHGGGRELEVVYWEGRDSGHGKWLDRPETRDEVVRRVLA